MPTRRHSWNVAVESEVALRSGQRVPADVQVRSRTRAAARRINGEATGETERIQHVASASQRLSVAAVFALIKEEAGFLSSQHVGFKAQAGFQKLHPGSVGGKTAAFL